jgi:ketosteroid isomerase-like protein
MPMKDAQEPPVASAVRSAMASFERAQRARDGEALLAHFAAVPEFHLYNDGRRLAFDDMAAGVRAIFPTLRAIEGGFEDVQVIVLAADAALATARFRESVTDATGATNRAQGAATWLWRLSDGEWRIAYGQVDHYPDEG